MTKEQAYKDAIFQLLDMCEAIKQHLDGQGTHEEWTDELNEVRTNLLKGLMEADNGQVL